MKLSRITLAALGGTLMPVIATAQVPDLVSAYDAGGRAMGMGGATGVTGGDTLSAQSNPAGLGYMNRKQVGLTLRNRPESTSVVTGDLAGTQRFDTKTDAGKLGWGHIGVAVPLRSRGGKHNGTFAVTLTKGGYVQAEKRAGSGLVDGNLSAPSFYETLRNNTDFLTFAYGKANSDYTFNWGVGLIYAMNHQRVFRSAPSGTTDLDADAKGFGFVAGANFVPKGNPNMSFGVSYRSEIKLNGDDSKPLLFDRIPARLSGGVAYRMDGLRGGNDYVVLGADFQHYFRGQQSIFFDRDPQTVFGLGAEYSYSMGSSRIPVRLGYSFVPAAGNGFAKRNALTFGIGYRPNNSDWGIDLNWAKPQGGGTDMALNLFYRFGN